MYAIIQTGGKQYRVEEGNTIRIEKIKDTEEDQAVEFDRVLLVKNDDELEVGQPFLDHASVTGEIAEKGKGDKITVFKYKKRKGYRKKLGHRQPYMEVKINSINTKK